MGQEATEAVVWELGEGEAPVEVFEIAAGERCAHRLLLDGNERLSWRARVKDGYTIDLSARVFCHARRSEVDLVGRPLALKGVHNCRVLQEPERGADVGGCLDLGGEHAGCFGDFSSGRAVLELEFSNRFSYFNPKTVELHLAKAAGVPPAGGAWAAPPEPLGEAPYSPAAAAATPATGSDRGNPAAQKLAETVARSLASAEADGQWQRAIQLLGRMRGAGVAPDAGCFASAIGACRTAGHWEGALELLAEMQQTRVLPDRRCHRAAIEACEQGGQPEYALRLMEEMEAVQQQRQQPEVPAGQGASGPDADLGWLAWALSEALARCPADAHDVRHHLEQASASLAELAGRRA